MSYKKVFSRKDRVAARFLAQVHAALSNAAVDAKKSHGLMQKDLAEELDVHKSSISRILKGVGNPTIRTVGEISAVLGYRPELVLKKVGAAAGVNTHPIIDRKGNNVIVVRPATANRSQNPPVRQSMSATKANA